MQMNVVFSFRKPGNAVKHDVGYADGKHGVWGRAGEIKLARSQAGSV